MEISEKIIKNKENDSNFNLEGLITQISSVYLSLTHLKASKIEFTDLIDWKNINTKFKEWNQFLEKQLLSISLSVQPLPENKNKSLLKPLFDPQLRLLKFTFNPVKLNIKNQVHSEFGRLIDVITPKILVKRDFRNILKVFIEKGDNFKVCQFEYKSINLSPDTFFYAKDSNLLLFPDESGLYQMKFPSGKIKKISNFEQNMNFEYPQYLFPIGSSPTNQKFVIINQKTILMIQETNKILKFDVEQKIGKFKASKFLHPFNNLIILLDTKNNFYRSYECSIVDEETELNLDKTNQGEAENKTKEKKSKSSKILDIKLIDKIDLAAKYHLKTILTAECCSNLILISTIDKLIVFKLDQSANYMLQCLGSMSIHSSVPHRMYYLTRFCMGIPIIVQFLKGNTNQEYECTGYALIDKQFNAFGNKWPLTIMNIKKVVRREDRIFVIQENNGKFYDFSLTY